MRPESIPFSHPREQAPRGGVEPGRVSALEQSRQQRAGEVLAVLHPPLVETVQVPDDTFGEHLVLMQRDERAEGARSEALKKHKVFAEGVIWNLNSLDRKSTRLNSSHTVISYAVFCLTKKTR